MNILLVTCRTNSESDESTLAARMPLGLGYIASTLKKYTDHAVFIVDLSHKKLDFDRISSFIYKSKSPCIISGRMPKTIDEIPWPDWEAMDYQSYDYLPPWSDFPILSSRGCPFHCNY